MDGAYSLEKTVPSVKLSVEALPESKIQEISLDGRETFYRPLSMSENLCKMATKVDFLAEEEGRSDEEEDEEPKKSFQNQQWPWDGIRNHLRLALTEVSVLYDVLTIAQSKGPPKKEGLGGPAEGGKYMMFDHAPKAELPPAKLSLQIPAKKKGLNMAAEILSMGEKRMKTTDESMPDMSFHLQLLQLRQYWRIRKVGSKIFGDLSYRTAGSDFRHPGNFEVIKNTTEDIELPKASQPYAHQLLMKQKTPSAFKVNVPSDLKGAATVNISLKRKCDSNTTETVSCSVVNNDFLVGPNDPDWHKILSAAQNVLFCRELFNSLAKEAVQLKTNCTLSPFSVVGNVITANIFPDTEFKIELICQPPEDTMSGSTHSQIPAQKTPTDEGIFSLKFAAMKLLLENYQKIFNMPGPHPTTATFGLTKTQRKAPTRPFVLAQIQAVKEKQEVSLIERLVQMAKHWELKHRVAEVIDSLADEIQDPYLYAHWTNASSATEASVRIVIMSAGYEACNRTFVEMFVCTDTIRAVQKDGRAITLSPNSHHIRDYLLSLICTHQLSTVQEVCVISGWTILHYSLHSGVGTKSALGNIGSVMAVSPAGNSTVSMRCWLERRASSERIRYEVFCQSGRMDSDDLAPMHDRVTPWPSVDNSAVQDAKWSSLGGVWREVDWGKIFGRNFVHKFEGLITFLKLER